MASDHFNTVQALEMVLRDGSDLEVELTIVKAISIWHVVSFFRDHETEVFLKDRVNLCPESQAFAAKRGDRAKNSLFILFNFLDKV